MSNFTTVSSSLVALIMMAAPSDALKLKMNGSFMESTYEPGNMPSSTAGPWVNSGTLTETSMSTPQALAVKLAPITGEKPKLIASPLSLTLLKPTTPLAAISSLLNADQRNSKDDTASASDASSVSTEQGVYSIFEHDVANAATLPRPVVTGQGRTARGSNASYVAARKSSGRTSLMSAFTTRAATLRNLAHGLRHADKVAPITYEEDQLTSVAEKKQFEVEKARHNDVAFSAALKQQGDTANKTMTLARTLTDRLRGAVSSKKDAEHTADVKAKQKKFQERSKKLEENEAKRNAAAAARAEKAGSTRRNQVRPAPSKH